MPGPVHHRVAAALKKRLGPFPLIRKLAAACILVTLAALVAGPALVGLRPLTVLTSSMEPGLSPGDVVLVRSVDPEDVQVGDVLTFQPAGSAPGSLPVTHRLAGFSSGPDGSQQLVLRGDANPLSDPAVPASALQGRVAATIPYLGYPDLLAQRAELGWIRPLLGTALFGYAALLFFQHLRQRRSSRSSQGPTA